MGAKVPGGRAANSQRVLLIAAAILGVPVFTGIVLFAGIGIAALLGRSGSTDLWTRWGNVGQTFESINTIFSGLAFVALVVTFAIQFQELRMQRIELKLQREAMKASNGSLHTSAAANLRSLHMELMRMAIDDPELAAVWPDFDVGLSIKRNRQYLYANLIIQHLWLYLQIGEYSEDEARGMLHYMFSSPLMRDYWAASERVRRWLVADTPEHLFAKMVDDLYGEDNPGQPGTGG